MFIRKWRERRQRKAIIEAEHEARMEKADRDLNTLRQRANIAINEIDTRDRRNHYQDAVRLMIQGGI